MTEHARTPRHHLTAFLLLLLVNCWLWMQAVHELGHALAALLSSGHVTGIVWQLTAVSRTDVRPNPHPLFVCWAGPILGCVIPLIVTFGLSASKRRFETWMFFAGFCLVANGAYIAIGSIDRIGDAGDLLHFGSPTWLLWLVGVSATIAGLILWHRLGSLSDIRSLRIDSRDVALQTGLFCVTIMLQATVFAQR